MAFIPGDIVRLNSGGPTMTVAKCKRSNASNLVCCQWFTRSLLDPKVYRAWFNELSLEHVTPRVAPKFTDAPIESLCRWLQNL